MSQLAKLGDKEAAPADAAVAGESEVVAATEKEFADTLEFSGEQDLDHMLAERPGHFWVDTPGTRAVIRDAERYGAPKELETNSQGYDIVQYTRWFSDGSKSWARVLNGRFITDGGYNPPE
jgi:hypothetical protein